MSFLKNILCLSGLLLANNLDSSLMNLSHKRDLSIRKFYRKIWERHTHSKPVENNPPEILSDLMYRKKLQVK